MARSTATTQTVRRSIEMHPRTDERIKWLIDELEATSVSEVIRRALQVLETLVRDEKQGRRLLVEDERGRMREVTVRFGATNEPARRPTEEAVPITDRN